MYMYYLIIIHQLYYVYALLFLIYKFNFILYINYNKYFFIIYNIN